MKPKSLQVPGRWPWLVGAGECETASRLRCGIQSNGQQGALNPFITMLYTATRGSNRSSFVGNVQNASAGNYALMLSEKRLGSVSESKAVEGIEYPRWNFRFVDRRVFLGKTRCHGSRPRLR